MKATPLQLPNGRTLEERRGAWIIKPPGITVAVVRAAGEILVTDPDTGSVVYQGPVAAGAAGKGTGQGKKERDRRRWVTLNTFVDRVARHLEPIEAAVWLVMFRFTQDDTAEVRVADIAARIGKTARSVQRAIDMLTDAGLIERIKRGTRQGGPSRYRLEPDPAATIPRLQASTASQPDTGVVLRPAPKHQKRDRRGAFTT